MSRMLLANESQANTARIRSMADFRRRYFPHDYAEKQRGPDTPERAAKELAEKCVREFEAGLREAGRG